MTELARVTAIVDRISARCFSTNFIFMVDLDKKYGKRVYIQTVYYAEDTKGKSDEFLNRFKGRKWYLSPHMTDDEIVKTCFLAFEITVRHEILEGFRVDKQLLFNPHTPFDILQTVSSIEHERPDVQRKVDE